MFCMEIKCVKELKCLNKCSGDKSMLFSLMNNISDNSFLVMSSSVLFCQSNNPKTKDNN